MSGNLLNKFVDCGLVFETTKLVPSKGGMFARKNSLYDSMLKLNVVANNSNDNNNNNNNNNVSVCIYVCICIYPYIYTYIDTWYPLGHFF